jgi:NAD+ synthase (glutamine-hydrolysing)
MDAVGGSMRVRLVQLEVEPGRPVENTERMLLRIATARADGIELLVFPELAVPGYLLGDEWERSAFLRLCEACGERLREAAQGLVVVFGNVAVDWTRRNEDGRVRKYNAVFVAEDGQFRVSGGTGLPFVPKVLQPNYRCFDDTRHFFDLRRLALERGRPVADLIAPIATARARLGCLLCEDAWDADYALSPGRILAAQGAHVLVNASCSPFTRDKNQKRNRVFDALARDVGRPLLYTNTVGVQDIGKTVYAFDGECCAYDGQGHVVEGPVAFGEGELTFDLPLDGRAFGQPVALTRDDVAGVTRALLFGTRVFMRRLGVRRVVIGVSGGIDSAVVAALYGQLVDPADLLLVNMPGPFSSQTTRGLARGLADELGALYAELPISDSVEHTRRQFAALALTGPRGRTAGSLALSPFALENVQARDRGCRLLAAAAAAFGGVFTCNANKAEITVGYGTLYGDIAGWLANLGDLWKGQVYEVGRHLNEACYGRPVIPAGIFSIVPSAELSAAQAVDEGKGDPLIYPYHDSLFRSWVERWDRATPEDLLQWYAAGRLEQEIGYEGSVSALFPTPLAFVADIERWWNLYQGLAVAKRVQAPPVLAVSRRAFGFDHREAQLGPRYTPAYFELRRRLLGDAP